MPPQLTMADTSEKHRGKQGGKQGGSMAGVRKRGAAAAAPGQKVPQSGGAGRGRGNGSSGGGRQSSGSKGSDSSSVSSSCSDDDDDDEMDADQARDRSPIDMVDLGLMCLMFSIFSHVLFAPYAKVEESFNLQVRLVAV